MAYQIYRKASGRFLTGQSTLELVVALGIIAISSGAAIAAFFGSRALMLDAQMANAAMQLAREALENTRLQAQTDFNSLANSTTTNNGFTISITVAPAGTGTKRVTARVSWQTDPFRTQTTEAVTFLTDWRQVAATGGDTGGSAPSGDWQHPTTLGSIDLGPGEAATDLDVKNKIVYMTAVASDPKKPDFFVIDATNGNSPVIVSSLDTGSGLNSIDVAGSYAYVVGTDDGKEFQVIDVSNIGSPAVVATLDLPGNADGLAVFYYNGYVYVGRASGAPQEFMVINVTNPLSPSIVSGLSNVGGEINDIYVYGNRAYITTEDNNRGMIVIDITNPAAPSVLGSMNSGAHAYGVYVKSNSLVYLGGRTVFYIVNASNPANITTLGSATIGYRTRDIAQSGSYAFLGTEDANREFQIWNISSSTNPTLWSYYNFPQVATGVDYEDNLVYISVRSNDALRIITSSP